MSAASTPIDWDAKTYREHSAPQQAWGAEVLDRLPLRGDEVVLDAGCGAGVVTAQLLERLPRGRVIAVDGSPSMAEQARATLPADRAEVLVADLQELELPERVDAIFSTAVFHWVPDHDRLFARLAAALKPGGRLVAQCGGAGNVADPERVARAVGSEEPFAPYLAGWDGPWRFERPEATAERLRRMGFEEVETWLAYRDPAPADPRTFLRNSILPAHLERLPQEMREPFTDEVYAALGEPETYRYVRLNIDAVRA